ncbi:uncharacterized protein I303_104977 [Kwoniella dejecticola CBS 10117]|uniref:Uncharacterized protein n=1 Tax=Kwoniella dejecticola CBS 10117 TaxID=1296121 RepID=A0A1A6A3T3_9TREE|nr:uncharacterized protein I303_05578 [Kwoniella dejecticola CBS 10117]OBR84719.1 hypothetical protein I303_05578 [Kwoniella dejecticola CBS 10117]
MALTDYEVFAWDMDEGSLSSSSFNPEHSAPRLPMDILMSLFDLFTSSASTFNNLKTAVQVNTILYSRYQPKLYQYIILSRYNIDGLVSHATLSLSLFPSAMKDHEMEVEVRRKRRRFLSLCRSIKNLEIVDELAARGVVQILSSKSIYKAQSLLFNVEYLILREGFMRSLQDFDWIADETTGLLKNGKMIVVLGKYLKPKHVCIDTLRTVDKKEPDSAEIRKIEKMKRGWKLESITLHNDIGRTRIVFSDVAKQSYYISLNNPAWSLILQSSVEGTPTTSTSSNVHVNIELYSRYPTVRGLYWFG